MGRNLSTAALARKLGVSEQTIRYHARKGAFPYDQTPGGHRRYDVEEVRAALARRPGGAAPDSGTNAFPAHGARLDPRAPSGQLTEAMSIQMEATAGYDERRFAQPGERLDGPSFMDAFAVPGSARYPQRPHAVGAGA